jgi:hypothetical protein
MWRASQQRHGNSPAKTPSPLLIRLPADRGDKVADFIDKAREFALGLLVIRTRLDFFRAIGDRESADAARRTDQAMRVLSAFVWLSVSDLFAQMPSLLKKQGNNLLFKRPVTHGLASEMGQINWPATYRAGRLATWG